MSYDKRPDQTGTRSSATGRGAVPLPGVPADFGEMISSLPDADSSADQQSSPQVIAAAGISDMFSNLPDADPGSTAAPSSKLRDKPAEPDLPDFELRTEATVAPAARRTTAAPRRAGQSPATPVARRKPQRPAVPLPIRPTGANELPPGVEDVLFADPPPPRSAPPRQPVAIPFSSRNQPSVGDAAEPGRTATHGRRGATNRPATDTEGPVDEISGRSITQQLLDLLERNGLAAVSQLRIEVHNGVVVVAGEVPTPYEKQLVAHFCRQVPGVEKFVDSMVVREARPTPELQSARPSRRSARPPIEWRLPFRAWHAGLAAGVVVLAWGVFSLGIGRGGPERLAVYPVTGSLLFEGQPAFGATIVLHPQDPSLSARPRATVEPDGSIIVTTYEPGDGAPAGEYKATVEWHRPVEGQESGEDSLPPPNVLPATYASPGTTPVRLTIEEGENEFPTISFPN